MCVCVCVCREVLCVLCVVCSVCVCVQCVCVCSFIPCGSTSPFLAQNNRRSVHSQNPMKSHIATTKISASSFVPYAWQRGDSWQPVVLVMLDPFGLQFVWKDLFPCTRPGVRPSLSSYTWRTNDTSRHCCNFTPVFPPDCDCLFCRRNSKDVAPEVASRFYLHAYDVFPLQLNKCFNVSMW